jgi:putative Ca2+/H+ antiporter (TMEM165/GDT1 family)
LHIGDHRIYTNGPCLQKPTDLPDKPHDIPHPGPKGVTTPETLKEPPQKAPQSSSSSSKSGEEEAVGVIQPFHSFVLSLTMILFSEIGDKTFLIAALMAMRHARLLVFSAAFSALITMTVLSAVLGHAVPTLLPKRFTNFAAAVLFLVFGAKMLREGLAMSPDEGVGEEMKEVEMELEEKEHLARRNSRRSSNITPYILEAGRGRRSRSDSRLPAPPRSPSSSPSHSPGPNRSSFMSMMDGANNLLGLLLSPAWVQTFVMTFLGEWGDRSQIATIAMAAGQDYWWVTGGAISGHACCTAVAVVGGRAIAGRVSVRYGKFMSPRLSLANRH